MPRLNFLISKAIIHIQFLYMSIYSFVVLIHKTRTCEYFKMPTCMTTLMSKTIYASHINARRCFHDGLWYKQKHVIYRIFIAQGFSFISVYSYIFWYYFRDSFMYMPDTSRKPVETAHKQCHLYLLWRFAYRNCHISRSHCSNHNICIRHIKNNNIYKYVSI